MGRTRGRNSRDEHVIPSPPDQGTTRQDRAPGIRGELVLEALYFVGAIVAFVAAMLGISWWWLALYASAWLVTSYFRFKIITGRERLLEEHRHQLDVQIAMITRPWLEAHAPDADDLVSGRVTMVGPPPWVEHGPWTAAFRDGPLAGTTTPVQANAYGLPPLSYARDHGRDEPLLQPMLNWLSVAPVSYYALVDLNKITRFAYYEVRELPVVVTIEDVQRWRDVLEQQ